MNSETINDSISFLQEALDSDIFTIKDNHIKYDVLLKEIAMIINKQKINKQQISKNITSENISIDKQEDGGNESDDESEEYPSETIYMSPSKLPSEYYNVSENSVNSQHSKYNLAIKNSNSSINGISANEIVNY